MSIDKDVEILNRARKAQAVSEEVDALLDSKLENLINSVMSILSVPDKTLDPQLAVQKWMEVHAIKSLKRTLNQRIAAGQTRKMQ